MQSAICVQCADGIHNNCGTNNSDFETLCQNVSHLNEVSFFKWVLGGKFPEKKLFLLTGPEAADELRCQVEVYLRHSYNKYRQHQELRLLKSSLDATAIVVQVDFSENYTNKQVNEIQSAYFGQECFTLYTACVWFKDDGDLKCKSFCFVTDKTDHNKYVACHFNNVLISKIREFVSPINAVHFWSDGCGGQFKSKFCFALLGRYPDELKITWSYFESHHGKGPVDEIGGLVKTAMYREVKACKVVFSNAKQFAEYANKHVQAITIIYVGKDEMPTRPMDDDLVQFTTSTTLTV